MAEPGTPRIRRAPLPDDAVLVVGGDNRDPETSPPRSRSIVISTSVSQPCSEQLTNPAGTPPARGSGAARGVALVVDITDGIVHVRPLRGSVTANAHLLDDPSRLAS